MDHEADVGLIYPHAERIGGDDDPEFADAEAFLNVALFVGRKSCVKAFGQKPLLFKKLGHFFCLTSRGTIDHRARCALLRQLRLDDIQYVVELGAPLRGPHLKSQIGAHRTAVQQQKVRSEARPEMLSDIAHHLGLCRGGQAEHRSERMIARKFFDEAANIAVVWPKIMAPFRNAMGLVQHPEPDLPLRQNRTDGNAAQLLRRNQQHGRFAHAYLVERILPLGHREHAIDRDSRGNASPRHALHLICH